MIGLGITIGRLAVAGLPAIPVVGAPTPANTRANSHAVRANADGFRAPLLALQTRFATLGG